MTCLRPERGALREIFEVTDHIKTIHLAGVETRFTGNPDDPYFQNLDEHARGLDDLAALVNRKCSRDSTVLDVGANIGLSTLLLARLTGRVVAYEPSPPNVALLRQNLLLNGIRNVEVVAAAVSDRPGTLRLHVAQFGAGSHVVAAGHVAGATIPTVEVPALPLDEQDLPPIAFIKIDAEGHEPDVLAGARELLERDRPLIYTEINIWCLCAFAGHSPGALVRALWESFEVGKAAPDGEVVPLANAYTFLHDTITRHTGVADIVLHPRAGARMPTLPELTWPRPAILARSQGAPQSPEPSKFTFVPDPLAAVMTVDETEIWRNRWAIQEGDHLTSFSQEITSAIQEFQVKAGGTYVIHIEVKNTGAQPWFGNALTAPIHASYRRLDANGNVLPIEGNRALLNRPVIEPDESDTLQLQIPAPSNPGSYMLCISMVQEGVAWFCDRGAKPLVLDRVRIY